jgi:hypothetical protein
VLAVVSAEQEREVGEVGAERFDVVGRAPRKRSGESPNYPWSAASQSRGKCATGMGSMAGSVNANVLTPMSTPWKPAPSSRLAGELGPVGDVELPDQRVSVDVDGARVGHTPLKDR